MKNRQINTERVVSVVGFIFLLVSCLSSTRLQGDSFSILEYFVPTAKLIPIVHGFCAIVCFILIFVPNFSIITFLLLIESFLTIETNYEQLGIFFFYAYFSLLYLRGNFEFHKRLKLTLLFGFHVICLMLMLSHGIERWVIAIATSVFYFAFYMWLYAILKEKLTSFLPSNVSNNSSLSGIQQGSSISLSKYGLTERQTLLTLDFFQEGLSYKDLSDKHNISISTVKKEFTEIFKCFSVTRIEELSLLLLQYKLKP